MRAAERGEKVVQRVVVRQVDEVDLRTPLVPIAVNRLSSPTDEIEQIAVRNTGRIVVVVLGSWRRYLYERRTELRCRTIEGRGAVGVARTPLQVKPASRLLIGGKGTPPTLAAIMLRWHAAW